MRTNEGVYIIFVISTVFIWLISAPGIRLGLGIFIGKTLLEKNSAQLICRNSQTRGGAEVKIVWKNNDLKML